MDSLTREALHVSHPFLDSLWTVTRSFVRFSGFTLGVGNIYWFCHHHQFHTFPSHRFCNIIMIIIPFGCIKNKVPYCGWLWQQRLQYRNPSSRSTGITLYCTVWVIPNIYIMLRGPQGSFTRASSANNSFYWGTVASSCLQTPLRNSFTRGWWKTELSLKPLWYTLSQSHETASYPAVLHRR